jgi:single-stranded-DNA-specific exonuclease
MKSYSVREFKGDTLLDHLLYHRGIVDKAEREAFLNPSYDLGLNDPYLLSDMEKAVDRIDAAMLANEKITIFSDYDADGIPGAVVFSDFFKMIGYKNVEVYIPHRHDEGFGLNLEAIGSIAKNGAKLVITIDCGITDVEEVTLAKKLGMDTIITDHHEPGPVLPDAFAIVDPKISPEYPDKMICGSGVIFKLVQAMLKKDRRGVPEGREKWLLDMVGIATLSDMVPLKGENRVFATYGLTVLRKSPRVGLVKLLKNLKISQKDLVEDDIGFMITPRINVASRMSDPSDAFRLLSTDNEEEAEALVEKLNDLNVKRKSMVAGIMKEIKHKYEARHLEDKAVIVLGNPSWNPAVLGLVANSLMKEYRKPAFLWGRADDETLKGSCRSEGQTDVVALMHGVTEDIFIDRGGHKMSGGFSVSVKHIHLLDELLNNSYAKLFSENVSSEEDMIADHLLSLEDISFSLWDTVDKLSPFGMDNAKPLFLLKGVSPAEVKLFGKQKEHIELMFARPNGKKISAISFFASEDPRFASLIENTSAPSTPLNLVATLERSTFRNFPELRLRIVDIF